ncbi:hypothetical protein AGMMS50256_22130 [Betaproteobacteria bacterium]|nr:hypothetical protein AGMMS50256_22130 [Betaproteobacteria bacterium]
MAGEWYSEKLRDLLVTTKDGDWGKDSPDEGLVAYRVIRGTDFLEVRRGDVSSVPLRYLNGSTFLEISKSNFRPLPVIIPSEAVLSVFRHQVEPLYQNIVENERESCALAQLRDTLLPQLVSGELRIAQLDILK